MYGRNRAEGPLSAASVLVHPSAKTRVHKPSRRAAAAAAAAAAAVAVASCRRHRESHPTLFLQLLAWLACTRSLWTMTEARRGAGDDSIHPYTPPLPPLPPLWKYSGLWEVVADQRLISSHWYSRRRLFIHLWKDIHILLQCVLLPH